MTKLVAPRVETTDGHAILGVGGVKVGTVSHIGIKAPYPV